MHSLFLILFQLSCVILVLGILLPNIALSWTTNKSRARAIAIYAPVALVLFCLAFFTAPKQSDQSAEETMMQAGGGLTIASVDSFMPKQEKEFINTINNYSDKYKKETNVNAKTKLWQDRETALGLDKNNVLTNWVGTIQNIGTTSEGLIVLVLTVSDNITFQTYTNGFADQQDHTLISKDDSFYKNMSGLTAGTPIRFSAGILKSDNKAEADAMTNPVYIVKFANVEALK